MYLPKERGPGDGERERGGNRQKVLTVGELKVNYSMDKVCFFSKGQRTSNITLMHIIICTIEEILKMFCHKILF